MGRQPYVSCIPIHINFVLSIKLEFYDFIITIFIFYVRVCLSYFWAKTVVFKVWSIVFHLGIKCRIQINEWESLGLGTKNLYLKKFPNDSCVHCSLRNIDPVFFILPVWLLDQSVFYSYENPHGKAHSSLLLLLWCIEHD